MKHRYVSGLFLVAAVGALAQTKVDLGNQAKNVDFSQATVVRPFPVGVALPATCQVGQMFFLTTAPAGINECISTNVWQTIAPTGTTTAGSIDVKRSSATVLTIGTMCSVPTPCLFRFRSSVYTMLAPATITLTAGSGVSYVYLDTSANLTVGVSGLTTPAVTCSGCTVAGSITQYPLGAIPIETWNATNGSWDASGTSSISPLSAVPALLAGDNVTITQTAGTLTIAATGGSGSSGGSGSGGSGSGGSGSGGTGSTFNPLDATQFYRKHLTIASGFAQGADGWGYAGNCGVGSSPFTSFNRESIVGTYWAQAAGAGNECAFFFPAGSGGQVGSYDYWSGATPAQLWVSATYLTEDTNGTHYVGLMANANNPSDFLGCRQTGSGNWFAVIRAAGSDIASVDTGVAHDVFAHRLVVDNNSGTPNTIRCSVDGGNTATATGTIPSETFGWAYLFGTIASGAASANFGAFDYTIYLQGLPRQ